ncbi:ABC transporter ATP-binding protein [Vibrio sp. qd031]|uniref:ABC transporter ATP-binding protein n=1 Tax=Vibrio sp. qd031 TaxID=1603038 RepID=UPI000A11C04E|nr:ABC transporter ATP-binding protein [Vibrio sp. qd031]ORT49458.1 ABC transporter ATP-binding protein [Vibrio sp. qd031]
MEYILEARDLARHFGTLKAVDGVSFGVKTGSCFGLLGPNGAGKTTTIEMLEGIVAPTSGQILYQQQPIDKTVYEKLGIQFQHTALQDFLTVKETLTLFSAFYPHTTPIETLIEQCQLSEFLNQDHRKLSGGQKQRLLLALALINDPQLLFLDEPTTGLDPHSRRLFWDLINDIKASGRSILLTTHYMDEAEYLCDEIAVMSRGKIIEQGVPNQLLQHHFSGALVSLPEENFNTTASKEAIRVSNGRGYIQSEYVESTLSSLIKQGISLEGLQVKSATLDDLFLKLTGHSLEKDSPNSQEEIQHV